jgi:hypothetical protein
MSNKSIATIATMGIDIGKNSFHVVGLDQRGAIVLRQKWSRGQVEARLGNPPCLLSDSKNSKASWVEAWRTPRRPSKRNAE